MPIAGQIAIAVAMVGVGCVFGAIGRVYVRRSLDKVRHWHRTTGVVIGYSSRSNQGRTIHRPQIRYTSRSGDTFQITPSLGSSVKWHSIGKVVNIVVSPQDPHDGDILSWFSLWFIPLIMLFFSMAFFVTPCVVLLHNIKR